MEKVPMEVADTPNNLLYYFCYGSNLMAERMRMENIDAEFVSIAKLKKHRLIFNKVSTRWYGAAASLVKTGDNSDEVWGVVYRLTHEENVKLAEREFNYSQAEVSVETPADVHLDCITYIYYNKETPESDQWLMKPSRHYLSVIVYGAKQHNLPDGYIKFLTNIQTVEAAGRIRVFDKLVVLSGNALDLLGK